MLEHDLIHRTMKLLKSLVTATVLLLSASLFTGCMMMSPVRTISTTTYENPQWAPPYYSGARYYYLPDLELYYDLSAREYIFLVDGRWRFSPYIPAMYQNYDLENCFCVVLNVEVYKPWLHHQYYVSHYPRYYYRDYYDHSNIAYVRAYNENLRRAVYWNANERHRARAWDDANLRDNRRFKYSREDRQEQQNQSRQGSGTFGGQPRGQQQGNETQTRTTTTRTQTNTQTRPVNNSQTRSETNTQTRTENRPANNNQTRPANNTQTRTEATETKPETTRTSTSTAPARQATTNQETAPVRNNRTNYYGKTIGNSVRVTKEMKDNTPAPATRTQAPVARNARQVENGR